MEKSTNNKQSTWAPRCQFGLVVWVFLITLCFDQRKNTNTKILEVNSITSLKPRGIQNEPQLQKNLMINFEKKIFI